MTHCWVLAWSTGLGHHTRTETSPVFHQPRFHQASKGGNQPPTLRPPALKESKREPPCFPLQPLEQPLEWPTGAEEVTRYHHPGRLSSSVETPNEQPSSWTTVIPCQSSIDSLPTPTSLARWNMHMSPSCPMCHQSTCTTKQFLPAVQWLFNRGDSPGDITELSRWSMSSLSATNQTTESFAILRAWEPLTTLPAPFLLKRF